MPEPWQQQEPPVEARQAIAKGIQGLAAARLGRGFMPLVLLFLIGLAELWVAGFQSPEGTALSVGALSAGCAMLAYGLRVVENAFGRPPRLWKSLAMGGSLVPFAFALYVLGWRGLRQLAVGGGLASFGIGVVFAVMGTWVMRSWMRLVEVERLARVMTLDLDQGRRPA